MEKRYELPNGDTFVVTDEVRSRLGSLGLSQEVTTELLDKMAATAKEWTLEDMQQHGESVDSRDN